METPAWLNAQEVSPEQSKELGPVAPQTYGEPILLFAAASAAPARCDGEASLPRSTRELAARSARACCAASLARSFAVRELRRERA
jgi:hypothetical protein